MNMKTMTNNDLGKKYLVEECQKIRIDTIVRQARKGLLDTLIQGMVEIEGFNVKIIESHLYHGGKKLWFQCPLCKLARGVLYQHPLDSQIGCRNCLRLEYRSRAKKGMVDCNITTI